MQSLVTYLFPVDDPYAGSVLRRYIGWLDFILIQTEQYKNKQHLYCLWFITPVQSSINIIQYITSVKMMHLPTVCIFSMLSYCVHTTTVTDLVDIDSRYMFYM
jgi:hypothetical protein